MYSDAFETERDRPTPTQQVATLTDLHVSATATPAPTATPDARKIIFQDDRVVVTLERCENDVFYIYYDVRVAVKNTAEYLLITDAAQATDDSREAILFSARADAVDGMLYNTISSFDVSNADCSSARTLSALSTNLYQYDSFARRITPQPDGSLLLECVGNAQVMSSENNGSGTNYILSALTFTDRTGAQGRTEVLYRAMPSASHTARGTRYTLGAHSGSYGTSGITMYQEVSYYGDAVNEYYHVLFRLEDMPEALTTFSITGYAPGQEEPLFTASYRDKDVPAPVVTPTPTPTPVQTAHSPYPQEPDRALATYFTNMSVKDKVVKYSHYSLVYAQYGDFGFVSAYFRYHDPLPDTAVMRIVAIDGVSGNFGEASIGYVNLSNRATADQLGASIYSCEVHPDMRELTLACIDTATGETLFTTTFQPQGNGSTRSETYSGPRITPTPVPDAAATPAPTPAPTLHTEPPRSAAMRLLRMEPLQKDAKFSSYSCQHYDYSGFGYLHVRFRYHDPLPDTAVLRVTELNGAPVNYGEAPITAIDGDVEGLLGASICTTPLPWNFDELNLTVACIDTATGETLFETVYEVTELTPLNDSYREATPTPAATPALPTLPPETAGYDYINLTTVQSPTAYIHRSATFRAYTGVNAIAVDFGYNAALPEGTYLRIVKRNGTAGDYGQAAITTADDGVLSARIATPSIGLQDLYTMTLACIDPATEKTLFEFTLQGREMADVNDSKGRPISPRPTAPPPPTVYTHKGADTVTPAATQTPAATVSTPARTEPPQDLATYYNTLTISQKERKYSNYSANFRLYGKMGFVTIHFRYHDPLPETAVMRIVTIDGESGHFGEASVSPATLANAPEGLLCSIIHTTALTTESKTLTIDCIDTATGETLFTSEFKVDKNGRKLNDTFVDPEAPAATPTPAPVHSASADMLPAADVAGMQVVYEGEDCIVYRAADWYDQIMADAQLIILPREAGSALEISGLPRPDGREATQITLTLDAVTDSEAAQVFLPWRSQQLPLEQAPADGGFVRELGYTCTYLQDGGFRIALHECLVEYGNSSFALCGTLRSGDAPGSFCYTLRTDGTFRHLTMAPKTGSDYVDFSAIVLTATNHGHYISFMLPVDKGDDYIATPTASNGEATTVNFMGVIRPEDQSVFAYWYELPDLTDVPYSVTFDISEAATGQVLESIRSVRKDYYWPFRDY